MIQRLKAWLKGLFAPRVSAQGLYQDPTAEQVERLIAAAGGVSSQGGSLYSKPTYAQFERLIAAVAAVSSSSAASVKSVTVGDKSVSPEGGVLSLPVTDSTTEDDGGTLASAKAVKTAFDQSATEASYEPNYTGLGLTNRPAILLKHGSTVLAAVDADAFVVDGMVDDVYIGSATSGPEDDPDESGKLVIRFNVDAGQKVIKIPLARIFNPQDYYSKDDVDGLLEGLVHLTGNELVGGHKRFEDAVTVGTSRASGTRGSGSFVQGDGCLASGAYSSAQGLATKAQNQAEHAEGKYNASHTGDGNAGKTIHSIGFGTANNARANAVETMQDGKTYVYGLGGYDGTNPAASGVKDLAAAVEGKANKPAAFTPGNLPKLDNGGNPVDSGIGSDNVQAKLTFDQTPTADSANPVTSGGVKTAIDNAIRLADVVDDRLVPTEGPGTSVIIENGPGGGAVRYLAGHLPAWTCNASYQSAVERNRGASEQSYHYDPSLFPDRIVFWVEGKVGGDQGTFTRSMVFPKSGVYTMDIEYAAGYANYPNTMGQARFVVDAGTSGPQDIVGIDDPSIVQRAQVQFAANAGAGSITIKGKTGLSGDACCVVIASVKVTLVKEIGIEIGDIVAPDASAQTGQAADAAATYEALNRIANVFAGKSISTEPTQNEVNELMRHLVGSLGGTVE